MAKNSIGDTAAKAILSISAHWYTEFDGISTTKTPETIHDFYGFPPELYQVEYPAPGAPELALRVAGLLKGKNVAMDTVRGLDHGAWSVLHVMYPQGDIPVCQLSVNANNTPKTSYELGQMLLPLREEGVLILASGNIVHNLAMVDWNREEGGYPWADYFDKFIKKAVLEGKYQNIIQYEAAGNSATQAFVYRDHYDPLLYALGAVTKEDTVTVFNEERMMGSLSMTSYLWK